MSDVARKASEIEVVKQPSKRNIWYNGANKLLKGRRMNEFVAQKAKAKVVKSYKVTVDFMFTDEQLKDATPMTFTAKQLFDMLVEKDDTITTTIKENIALEDEQIVSKVIGNLQRKGEVVPQRAELIEKIRALKA